MKKIYFALFLTILFTYHQTYSQCAKGITTNPAAPVNNERPDKTNTFFDWTQLLYDINSQYILAPQIDAPVNQGNNAIIHHFLNNQDRLPQDGWELIQYDLGYNEDGTPKTTPVGFIHIVLYNKYTGVLRVFVAGDRPQAYNGAKISIGFLEGIQSSVLSNASKIFALDTFEAAPTIASVSPFNNNSGRWFYADFQMSYDVCTCLYESTLGIWIHLINQSNINLTGNITGTLTSIANNTGSVTKNGDSYSFDPKNIATASKKAIKTYKDMSSFVNEQEKALGIYGKTDAELEQQQQYDKLNKRHSLNAFQQIINSSDFLKAGLKAVPYVGAAVELLNFFSSGGKSGPQEVKVMPMALNATVNLKGTLTAEYNYGDITFYTPGSKNAHIKNATSYPYYNEVLGVFNLLETPEVYAFTEESYHYFDQYSGYYVDHENAMYQLKPLKYVINPASGLKISNAEIFVSLELGTGFKTSYVPLSAAQSFFVRTGYYSTGDYHNTYESYIIGCSYGGPQYLNLLINLERTDTDENTQNVLIKMKYPIKTASTPNTSVFSPSSYCDIPQKKMITNTTVSGNVLAWDEVTIGPNVTFTGNVTVRSNSIIVQQGVTIPPNVTLVTGLANGHVPYQVPPATANEIQTFCTTGNYKPLTRALRVRGEESNISVVEEQSINISVYPNPTESLTTFRYFISEPTHVTLSLVDLMGRTINIVNTEMDKGIHEHDFDTSQLPKGIYVYSLQTHKKKVTGKLVVR